MQLAQTRSRTSAGVWHGHEEGKNPGYSCGVHDNCAGYYAHGLVMGPCELAALEMALEYRRGAELEGSEIQRIEQSNIYRR